MSHFRNIRIQLIGIYVLLALLGAAGMYLSSQYVHGHTREQLARMMLGLFFGFSVIVVLLSIFTMVRLKVDSQHGEAGQAADHEVQYWNRLTQFPKELLVCYFVVGMMISQLYHLWDLGAPPWPRNETYQYWKSTLSNLSTFIALGMIHYSAARWILRSQIRRLNIYCQSPSQFRSVGVNLILILVCGIVFMVLRMLLYTLHIEAVDEEPQHLVLLSIWGTVFAVTFIVIYYMAFYLFRDLERMTVRLRELARSERGELRSRVPIASPYESGELTAAFNALQSRFEMEYARLDRDLDLAYRVQEQLFAHHPKEWSGWHLRGTSNRSKEVKGGFYDILPLTEERIALAAGTVAGHGLPAALVVSALIMLLRTNIQAVSCAGSLLTELNAALAEMMQDGLHIHIALILIDQERRVIEYASAGAMSIQIDQRGVLHSAEPRMEPIGNDRNRRYGSMQLPLYSGECLIEVYSEERSSITAHRIRGDR